MADLRVPEYFPLTVKQCTQPSTAFFQCFTNKGAMQSEGDRDAGNRGLVECKEELAQYKRCMDKYGRESKHYFPK